MSEHYKQFVIRANDYTLLYTLLYFKYENYQFIS